MQKDFHFYVTFALARVAGVSETFAKLVAWANQYTDDCSNVLLYGIQTQADILGNWADEQIQHSVIVPFHFLPGDDDEKPWMTTANSSRAQKLIAQATNPFELGIALHTLQDTFSHQQFSGWREDLNSCYSWYYLRSVVPNVGHAEMGVVPDVINYTWTDPRNDEKVNNIVRAMEAAEATLKVLQCAFENEKDSMPVRSLLGVAFNCNNYDDRKQMIRKLSGNNNIRYSELTEIYEGLYKGDFMRAACKHAARAMAMFGGLPRGP